MIALLKKKPEIILVISLLLLFGSIPFWADIVKHPEYSDLRKICVGVLLSVLDIIGIIGWVAAVRRIFNFLDDLPQY